MDSTFFTREQLGSFSRITFNYLKVSLDNHLLTITLARPEKRNAFTPLMAEEIAFVLGYANKAEDVRCVVIRAEGPVFCAGADLNSFLNDSNEIRRAIPPPLHEVNLGEAFATLYKPSIAQIEGPVLAGGFLILAGVTFAFSVPHAHFTLPEVKRGLWPMQVMASLNSILPARKVLEMCITANTYSASEALEMGLISKIHPVDTIERETHKMALQITEHAPLAISRGMHAFQDLRSSSARNQYRHLQEKLAVLLKSDDAAEGILAFREKRKPIWKNR